VYLSKEGERAHLLSIYLDASSGEGVSLLVIRRTGMQSLCDL
jgi:hypothetical protein